MRSTALLVLTAMTWLQAATFTPSERAWIAAQHTPLRLGVDPGWMPIDGLDPHGRHIGMASGYFELITAQTGLQFAPVMTGSWSETVAAIEQGKVDVVSAVMPTPRLARSLQFTAPYLSGPVMLYLHAQSPFIDTLEQLHGRRIAMVKGSEAYERIRNDHPQILFHEVPTIPDGLMLLENAQVFGFLENRFTAARAIREGGYRHIVATLQTTYRFDLGIGVHRSLPPEALFVFKKVLHDVEAKKHETIRQRWTILPETKNDLLPLLGLLGVISLGVVFSNIWLRREITRRKMMAGRLEAMNRTLSMQKEQLDLAIKGADLGTWHWDLLSGQVTINDRWATMLGYHQDEVDMRTETMAEYIHPEDLTLVRRELDAHLQGTSPFYHVTMRLRTKGGTWHWVQSGGKICEYDAKGTPLKMAGVHADIHAERTAVEAERRQEHLNQVIMDTAVGGIYIFDVQQGCITYANRQYTQLLGYTLSDLNAMERDAFYALFHPDSHGDIERHIAALLGEKSTQVHPLKYRFRHKQGHWLWLQGNDRVLEFDPQGNVTTFLGTFIDVTEDETYLRQVTQTQLQLQRSNENLQQFAYAASHDLQEPLRMISGHLQLIERRYGDLLDEKGHTFLGFAVEGAQRMQRLIQGLLQFSRVETGGTAFAPVDLQSVLQDVRGNLARQFEERGVTLHTAPLPTVNGDRAQLAQVLQNLIGNAVKFCPDRPPVITLTASREPFVVHVCIKDNGIGIAPKYHARIFEMFKRLNQRKDFDGEGIGLALCKRIIEHHGGTIDVHAAEGEGTTICFTLPDTLTPLQGATHDT